MKKETLLEPAATTAHRMPRNPDDLIPTRRSLLTRLKNWDDQESWLEFFNTYWKLIYGVAIKSGLTEVEAQEVVQETIIAVWKQMPEFKYDPAIGSFKGWLLHTTRWKIGDQLRRRRHQGSIPVRANSSTRTATIDRIPDPGGGNLDAIWHQEWQKNVMEAAIERVKKKVKPRHYQIFDLYVVKHWPIDKVSSILGVNIGQIYLAKHRISALIKKEVKDLENKLI